MSSINRPPCQNFGSVLRCEQLEDRTNPTPFFVNMISPYAGVPGSTGAIHSGGLTLDPGLPSSGTGVLIDAQSEAEAVRLAISGEVAVFYGGQSVTYPVSPGLVGLTTAAHLPFVVSPDGPPSNWRVWLEDLAAMPGVPADWD